MLLKTTKTFVLSLLLCSAALACRPLTVDDCPPTAPGKFGIETGIASARLPGYDSNISELTSIKYGLLDKMDIGLDFPYQSFSQTGGANESGPGDITLKTKINLVPVSEKSAGLSVVTGVKLSTGDASRRLGSGTTDYSVNSILTREFKDFRLHLNLGYTFLGQAAGQTLKNVASYGCALEAPLAAEAKLLAEIYGSTNSDPAATVNPLTATLGANKELWPGLTADAGWSVGLNDAAPNRIITVGLTGAL